MDRTEDRSKEPKTKLVLDDGRIESIQAVSYTHLRAHETR